MSNLNLKYYDGTSLYIYPVFKNINNEIIDIIKKTENLQDVKENIPVNITKFIDPKKINALKSFKFKKSDKVLEINPCFGIVTEYLCDKVKEVTTIEFSKQNADILNERLSKKDNLEIIVGNISNIEIDKKFNYIILNDIIEFSSFFFKSMNPTRDLIHYFKRFLKPSGTLIIQTNNRFGLKNWLGSTDEHTGLKYNALVDYPEFSLHSLSKKELSKLLNEIGFEYVKFYYPIPDMFSPNEILTDETINNIENIEETKPDYILINEIKRRKEFDFFANSFLVVAKIKKPVPKTKKTQKTDNNSI